MRNILIIFFFLVWPFTMLEAKSYRFQYDAPRSTVKAARSTTPGTKMVEVVAYGKTSDKAIDQASVDAIATAIFHGIQGNDNIDNIPPILLDGDNQYKSNKKFFDKFFKKGEFIKYVHHVNSTYPTGTNNVASPNGRKVTILLIIDWRVLETYLQSQGCKTLSSKLKFE